MDVLIKLLNQLKNKTHISWMWKNIIKKKKANPKLYQRSWRNVNGHSIPLQGFLSNPNP